MSYTVTHEDAGLLGTCDHDKFDDARQDAFNLIHAGKAAVAIKNGNRTISGTELEACYRGERNLLADLTTTSVNSN